MKQSTFNKIARLVDNAGCLNDIFENYFSGYDVEDLNSSGEIFEILDDNMAYYEDIIYYDEAMKYLMEHDMSLTNSLELAEDMEYSASDLNSVKLASILATSFNREELEALLSEIDEIIDNE